jgi:hypothetical protein
MNNISEPTFFTEKNLVIIAIVIITVIILNATKDSIMELFIQTDASFNVNNFFIKDRTKLYYKVNPSLIDSSTNPVNINGIFDLSGSRIMIKTNEILVDSSNNLNFNPMFYDASGINKINIVRESDYLNLKSNYSRLDSSYSRLDSSSSEMKNLLITSEENANKYLKELSESEEDIGLKNNILFYGGIVFSFVFMVCVVFTYLYFKK